jgi:hypothetical protein
VRCDGRDQAVATVAAATIQPRRAARAAPLRAAAVGGAARMWADTHRRPVRQAASTSYSPQNRPRPPSARPQRPLDLSINRHVGFCHFLSIVVQITRGIGAIYRSENSEHTDIQIR